MKSKRNDSRFVCYSLKTLKLPWTKRVLCSTRQSLYKLFSLVSVISSTSFIHFIFFVYINSNIFLCNQSQKQNKRTVQIHTAFHNNLPYTWQTETSNKKKGKDEDRLLLSHKIGENRKENCDGMDIQKWMTRTQNGMNKRILLS